VSSRPKLQFRPLTAVLLAAGVVFIILAVVYFTTAASSLPSVLPGHQAGSTRHHTKHGIAMVALAVLALIGAWFSTAPATSGSD
jgi:hypothetical protein